jgi:hypothetical protein
MIELFGNSLQSDITIEFQDGSTLPGHTFVLSMWCDVFKQLFFTNHCQFAERETKVLKLASYDTELAKQFVRCVYTLPAALEIKVEDLSLFKLAHAYGCFKLMKYCMKGLTGALLVGLRCVLNEDRYTNVGDILLEMKLYEDQLHSDIKILWKRLEDTVYTQMARRFQEGSGVVHDLKWIIEHFISCLDPVMMSTFVRALNGDDGLTAYIVWMSNRHSNIVSSSEETRIRFGSVNPDDKSSTGELDVLQAINWFGMSQAAMLHFYNQIVSYTSIPNDCKQCILLMLLDLYMHIHCSSQVTRYSSKYFNENSKRIRDE